MNPAVKEQGTADTRPRRLRSLSDRAIANLFLLPLFLLLLGMNIFPLFWSLLLSFCQYKATANVAPVWIGIANYSELLADAQVWKYFGTTARFVGLAVSAQFIVGFSMALLLNRQFPGRSIVTTLLLIPMMLSPVVVGLFWRFLFDPSWGLINALIGQPVMWLTDPRFALWSLVIVDTWMWSPFIMLIALAGLKAVPLHLYEAAEVDRASTWFKFRHITLPIIAPLLLVALLFRTMDAFKLFDAVYVLTSGGPGDTTETVSMFLYRLAFSYYDTGKACALAYIVLVMIIGMANLYIKLLNRIRGEGLQDDLPLFAGDWFERITVLRAFVRYRWGLFALALVAVVWPFPLNALRWLAAQGLAVPLALTFAVGVGAVAYSRMERKFRYRLGVAVGLIWGKGLFFAVVAVLLVVYLLPVYWIGTTSFKRPSDVFSNPPRFTFSPTLENYDKLLYKRDTAGATLRTSDYPKQLMNSVVVGLSSTALAVALGAMAAYAFARFRVKAKGDFLFFILSTRMLPAIVVAIPIFLMYRGLGLLDTYVGLALLYTVFNVSFATWLMKGFFDEVPGDYEDAALLDGYSRFQAFRKVTLPQVRTGIAATAVFCLLTSWNEFAFALFLTNKEVRTAPPGITSALGIGGIDWGQIAAGTLIFLLPVAAVTFLMRNHLLRGVTFGAIKR